MSQVNSNLQQEDEQKYNILFSLYEGQNQAVISSESYIRVVLAADSGKTITQASKVAY